MNNKFIADGKEEAEAKSIYELMGAKGKAPYPDKTVDEYIKRIKAMNLHELQGECIKHGMKPNASRTAIIARLKREYSAKMSVYKSGLKVHRAPILSKEKEEKAKEILKKLNS